eukprot:41902-Eustigmatos_ZCMA.PRE.1
MLRNARKKPTLGPSPSEIRHFERVIDGEMHSCCEMYFHELDPEPAIWYHANVYLTGMPPSPPTNLRWDVWDWFYEIYKTAK